jgi:cell division protein FtsI/penicillin-binding protein 2
MRWSSLCLFAFLLVGAADGKSQVAQNALASALRGTGASAIVLDWKSGAVLAGTGTEPRAMPGSVLKPLLLEYALEHGVIRPETTVYCRRSLHVAGRNLACTHPATQPMLDAESALAESCNTWFAEMARRMTDAQLEDALRVAHVQHDAMSGADADTRVLTVLGLQGAETTPEELARSYRELLLHVPADGVVARGLEESVEYGMANPARVRGVSVLGKTGTASERGQAWTHGWFAGGVPGKLVMAVYVPHGDGGTAAALAARFLRVVSR